MRQLSRRVPRNKAPRHSATSQAAILGTDLERTSTQLDGSRPRSLSGSSALLLGRGGRPESLGLEGGSSYGAAHSRSGSTQYTPTTPGGISAFSHGGTGYHSGGSGSPRAGVIGFKHGPMDPYYRPPRQQRNTLDGPSGGRHRGLSISNIEGEDSDQIEGPSMPGEDTPTPAYLRAPKEDPDGDVDDTERDRADYAVREVDFYYRVRGPALSKTPTRKLKTGPADPTGPVSSATGWFRGFFGGKTKDKAKGFEVVRSARAPPPGLIPAAERDEFPEHYEDEPDNPEGAPLAGPANRRESGSLYDPAGEDNQHRRTMSADPPTLPPIESSDAIELPSRTGSKNVSQKPTNLRIRPPTVPRRSSKRQSGVDMGSVK